MGKEGNGVTGANEREERKGLLGKREREKRIK
jgi:hypothetical protein